MLHSSCCSRIGLGRDFFVATENFYVAIEFGQGQEFLCHDKFLCCDGVWPWVEILCCDKAFFMLQQCNTPKYTLVVFDMFRVFCKSNLTVT